MQSNFSGGAGADVNHNERRRTLEGDHAAQPQTEDATSNEQGRKFEKAEPIDSTIKTAPEESSREFNPQHRRVDPNPRTLEHWLTQVT